MKASFFGIFSTLFLAATQVVASPVASSQLVKRQDIAGVDTIMNNLLENVKAIDAEYTSICAETCSRDQIAAWTSAVTAEVNTAADNVEALPEDYTFDDTSLISGLTNDLLVEINTTLGYLLGKGGLLGLLGGLGDLVTQLLDGLNRLLPTLSNLLEDLLDAVADLLTQTLASLGLTCYLCAIGLILVQ